MTGPSGNIEILGKQNELFPSGPVIKCLMLLLYLTTSAQTGADVAAPVTYNVIGSLP